MDLQMQSVWQLAHGRSIKLTGKAVIMGILNMTPDSFSDGASYASVEEAVAAAHRMAALGAHIIDIGGESTRPGSETVDRATEQARILPVIRALATEPDMLISVDTYHSETARMAVEAGAHIINDVWGLQKEPDMADLVAQTGAGVVIMHTGRERQRAPDVIADQRQFLSSSLAIAHQAGIRREQIVLDPGFGFGKTADDNIALLRRAAELRQFGLPLLAGTSRKRFLGTVAGREEAQQRDVATAASSVILRLAGFDLFRVHNVAANRDALAIADAVGIQAP